MDLSSHFIKFVTGRGRFLAASMAILLFAAIGCEGGCGGCSGPGGMPGSADGRAQDMASHLPADTEVAFVVGDLDKMRTSLSTTRDTFGDTLPMAALVEEQAKDELGIDVFDAESWKESGISPDGGMTITVVSNYPVLITYVDDQQKFEKAFSDQFKKSFDLEGMPKGEEVDGQQLKVLGEDSEQTAAWAYDGKLAVIGFPASEEIEPADGDERDVKQIVAALVAQEEEGSLASLEGFKKFNEALASEQSMAIFVNTGEALTEERMSQLKAQGDATTSAAADWIEKNVDAMGFGLHAEDNAMKIRAWASLPEDVAKRAQEIMTPAKDAPMGNFSTENTLIALRLSVDVPKLWKFYKETAPADQREQVVSQLEQGAKQAKLDFEKDIINQLAGNIAVYFYGVDKKKIEEAGGQLAAAAMQPMQTLALMVPVQFKDKDGREKITGSLTNAGFERSKVKDGVEALKMNVARPMGSVYVKDDLLVWASDVFSGDSVADYINGNRDEKKLADVDKLDLGEDLSSNDKYNGLYVNFERAKSHLGDLLARSQPQAVTFLEKVEEAALTTEVNDKGAYLDLSIDLAPQAAKKSDDDKE